MAVKLLLSGFLGDSLGLIKDLQNKDQFTTTIKDLSGHSVKISFQTIPNLMDQRKEYLKIGIEGTWIGIEKKPFIEYLKETRAYLEGLKKEKELEQKENPDGPVFSFSSDLDSIENMVRLVDPEYFQFFIYIESQYVKDNMVFVLGYPVRYHSQSFPIVFTQDTINKMKELLDSLKGSLNQETNGDQK